VDPGRLQALSAAAFISFALVVPTACLLTTLGRPRSGVSFVLAAYLLAWAELVVVVLGLSLFSAVRAMTLVTMFAGAFGAALLLWYLRKAPRPPALKPRLISGAAALRDPPLAILGALAALIFLYSVVLGILTPQNDWDALTYHLTRAALWLQQERVGYIQGSLDVRLNGNPPNAEIGQLAALALGGNERLVWFPQLSAALATTLAVFGIGRSIAWTVRESIFGALVFATLPLIALQSPTALNDLVVAAFFTVAMYFGLGVGFRSGAAATLALALGFGTKISAPLLLTIFVLVLLAARRRPVLETAAIAVAGALAGSTWYVVNLVNTGSLDGNLARGAEQIADRGVTAVALRAFRLMLNMFEVPGASGANGLLYALCTVGFLIAAGVAFRRRRPSGPTLLTAAVLVASVPVLVVALAWGLTNGWHRWWRLIGREDIAATIPAFQPPVLSDTVITWFGPLGVALVIVGLTAAVRGKQPCRGARIALAASPIAYLMVVAVGLTYDPWRGRFFVFPIALAAATWGSVYRFRGAAWAASALAVTTGVLVLAQNNEKSPGVRLLDGPVHPSVFGEPRWKVQTRLRIDGTAAIRFVEDHVPPRATVGLALHGDDYIFPYFGSSLDRTIRLLPPGSPATPQLDWIVEAPDREVPRCAGSWRTASRPGDGFTVLQRVGTDTCSRFDAFETDPASPGVPADRIGSRE